jgi:hypothetical protein
MIFRKKYIIDPGASVLLLMMAVLLGIPALFGPFADHAARVQWERRPLAEFPGLLQQDGAEQPFFSQLNAFLNDHTGFVLEFNRAYRRWVYYGFGDDPQPTITAGLDGFVFIHTPDSRLPYQAFNNTCIRPADASQITETLAKWKGLLDHYTSQGYRTGLIVAPSKRTLYPEKLPASVPQKYRDACASFAQQPNIPGELLKAGELEGRAIVYPFEDFLQLKDQGNFYPKENFHWHGRSAHVAARQWAVKLHISLPDSYSEHWKEIDQRADTSDLLGFDLKVRHVVPDYSSFGVSEERGATSGMGKYFKGRWKPTGRYVTQNPVTQRTALVIGNSFTEFLVPHLAPVYRELTWVMTNIWSPRETAEYVPRIVELIKPDDLIFVTHDGGTIKANKLIYSH